VPWYVDGFTCFLDNVRCRSALDVRYYTLSWLLRGECGLNHVRHHGESIVLGILLARKVVWVRRNPSWKCFDCISSIVTRTYFPRRFHLSLLGEGFQVRGESIGNRAKVEERRPSFDLSFDTTTIVYVVNRVLLVEKNVAKQSHQKREKPMQSNPNNAGKPIHNL
jgi:hypothetical protein